MGHGGARPGAGRPKKGAQKPVEVAGVEVPADMTPLDYMLSVMRDPSATKSRRDRMAQSAAPYVHVRADAVAMGKKEEAASKAQDAASPGNAFAPPPGPPKLVVSNR